MRTNAALVETAARAGTASDSALLAGVASDPATRAAADALRLDLAESAARLGGVAGQRDADRTSRWAAECLRLVTGLELAQAPGLSYGLPERVASGRPVLAGRARLAMTVRRPGDEVAFTPKEGGGARGSAEIELTLDGFSAPLTAGALADAADRKLLDGTPLLASGDSVFFGPGTPADASSPAAFVPLESLAQDAFEPQWRAPLDRELGEAPVLPLSIYGAVALSHGPADASNPDAATGGDPLRPFIYLFDGRSAGLAGLAFDEGTFSVAGYVTGGQELLPQLRQGDRVTSVRLVEGGDRLRRPAAAAE